MNGKIERAAREVLEKTWSTLLAYYILEHLQPFMIETVIQVMNTLPTRANPDLQSSYKQFAIALGIPKSAKKPYIRHFRAYFYEAYYYIKLQKRVQLDKFIVRAERGQLISYADLYSKLYQVQNLTIGKIVRATIVRFNEGPDFEPNDDVEAEYKAVVTNLISEEEDAAVKAQERITLIYPDKRIQDISFQQQEDLESEKEDKLEPLSQQPAQTQQLPTPKATLELQNSYSDLASDLVGNLTSDSANDYFNAKDI